MADPVIISAVRTPIGKFLGGLSRMDATALGAIAAKEALSRSGASAEAIDEVIMGNVLGAGLGQAPARQVALKAGLPHSVAAVTVNKVCGSGLKAVMLGAQAIKAGDASLILSGGMESMSRAPFLVRGVRSGIKFGDGKLEDVMMADGLKCAFENWAMGCAADYIAEKGDVSREEQDRFAVQSHHRAAAAVKDSKFKDEIIPIEVKQRKATVTIDADETIRPDANPEALAKLPNVFDKNGTVTAGNASGISDGAAAVVVASQEKADELETKPLAKIKSYAVSGVAPKDIFIAPVSGMQAAVEKAGLTLDQIDLVELNEAFAAQVLACLKPLNLSEEKVNVNGGAVALGHPIGASGTRVLVTLLHELKRRGGKYGLASLCLGGGNSVSMVVEAM